MTGERDSELGITQAAVDAVIAANPDKAAAYREGGAPALGFLLGQVMKMTGGQAHPATVQNLLRASLEQNDSSEAKAEDAQ